MNYKMKIEIEGELDEIREALRALASMMLINANASGAGGGSGGARFTYTCKKISETAPV